MDMLVRTLIVDDEKMAREELGYLLSLDSRFKIIGQAATGKEALKLIEEKKPELVFIDIKMPDLSGIEVGDRISSIKEKPLLVFTTAYDEYAVKAFQLAAADYLLKPIAEERFLQTLERVYKRLCEDNNKYKDELERKIDEVLYFYQKQKKENNLGKIPVDNKGRCKLLDQKEIDYFYTKNKKVYAHTQQESYLADFTLTDLEDILPDNFLRVHRSFIVNLLKVKEIIPWFKGNYYVIIDNKLDQKIPVSRKKVKRLNELLNLK